MSHLFGILLRILFPFDKVGRSRELMRAWLNDIMSLVLDPLNTPCFETDAENRTWLEGHIAATEYGMQVLVWERAREMMGLPFIYHRRQETPVFRRAKDMRQLYRRLSQLARNLHTLDRLAVRLADRMRREHDADPLGLAAPHLAPACADEATRIIDVIVLPPASAPRATSCRCAHARGPPQFPIPNSPCPHLDHAATENAPPRPQFRNLCHVPFAPLRAF